MRILPALTLATAAMLAFPSGPAEAAPPRAKDRPVREERAKPSKEEADAEKAKPKQPRSKRRWPGSGAVVVVPPSEMSSSLDRYRSDDRGSVKPGRLSGFSVLMGSDEAGVRRLLGQPAASRNEGQGALWTYRFQSCALHVFLARDDAGLLRVKGGSAGPLRRGAPAPALDACVAEAQRS